MKTPRTIDPAETWAARLAADWAGGRCLPAEDYLAHDPDLFRDPAAALQLVYEEVCQRRERGETVLGEELRHRFPQWTTELSALLDCDRLVRDHLPRPQFPRAGDTLGDFRLVAELGRGARGQVFLATQPTLADRPVVLKVVPRQDREFLSLARLQHTHIIPLHGAHDFPDRHVRALCQPYLGGATLGRLLDDLRPVSPSRRTGQVLLEALAAADAASPLPLRGRDGGAGLVGESYSRAVCLVGLRLAEALHHAHERGLVHLDLKPSNVLLTADAEPMLLDFHLALHPVAAGETAPDGLGGTPEYMSPEQRQAYTAAREGRPVPVAVDHRSDVYSLGKLLFQALAGTEPEVGSPSPRLREANPEVSPGLEAILRRCLEDDLSRRYPSADALADDLRRHLADLPLRGVANRSLGERWRKWRRRRPYAPLAAALLLALLGVPALLGLAARERWGEAVEALREGEAQFARRAHAESARELARGQERLTGWPIRTALAERLDSARRRAERAAAADRFHLAVESLRLVVGIADVSEGETRRAAESCRTAWEARAAFLERSVPLPDGLEARLRSDLVDLILLWAHLDPDHVAPRRDVLLAEVEQHDGTAGGDRENPVLIGRSLLLGSDFTAAATALERATEERPQDFWAHFYRGICAHRRARYGEAAAALSVAIALQPESAAAYHNRALTRAVGGDGPGARRDYDRALALVPGLAVARLNRGVLLYQEGQHTEARQDLHRALADGADPAAVHYNLALVERATGDATAAREQAERALRHRPGHAAARALVKTLGR